MKQSIFVIVLPVTPGRQGTLRKFLSGLNYTGKAPPGDPLGYRSLEMLHYASLFLYDDPEDGWSLVFESNIDGDTADYLQAFVNHFSANDKSQLVLDIFRNCQGFEHGEIGGLCSYLRKHIVLPSTKYSGCVGRSRNQILFEAEIFSVASQTLDKLPPKTDAGAAAKAVWQALEADPKFRDIAAIPQATPDAGDLLSALSPDDTPPLNPGAVKQAIASLHMVFRALRSCFRRSGIMPVVKAVFAAVVFVLAGIWNLLRKEPSAPADTWRPDPAHVRSQKAYEDFNPTNHMVSVVHLHSDFSRRAAKWAAFTLLDLLAEHEYTKGLLGAIPTIHFAHWAVLNDKRRLLFVSNFDGNWDSYLDDFTLKAARGLTLAWAHGKGFPRSAFMFSGGAAEGPAFIDWARRSMVPTLVWYNAYPHLSIRNINRNSVLRQIMVEDKDHTNAGNWLELMQ